MEDQQQEIMEKVNASLDQIGEWVRQGSDFAAEQAPFVVEEIIAWGIAYNVMSTVVLMTPVVIWFYIWGFPWRRIALSERGLRNDSDFPWYVSGAVGGFLSFLFVLGAYDSASKALQAIIAPRLYVISYLKDLL